MRGRIGAICHLLSPKKEHRCAAPFTALAHLRAAVLFSSADDRLGMTVSDTAVSWEKEFN